MWVSRTIAAYIVLAALTPRGARAEDHCKTVQRTIDAQVGDVSRAATLIAVAPYLGLDAAKTLHANASSRSLDEAAAFEAYLAVGLTRHAEALRIIRASPRPEKRSVRLARAIALLALGDGSESSTITDALFGSNVADRRRLVTALARMPQKRPQQLLFEVLDDEDAKVRFRAARVLAAKGSLRARRVLVDFVRAKDPELGARAARALLRTNYFFKPEELALLDPYTRMAVIAEDVSHSRRGSFAQAALQFRSQDPVLRAVAFASLAIVAPEPRLIAKRISPKSPEANAPELIMALSLVADPAAITALASFDRVAAEKAIEVLWAFTSTGQGRSQIEADHAGRIARVIEAWLMHSLLDEMHQSLAMRSLERLDPLSGLLLARTRLVGPDGKSLRTAVRVIKRSGSVGDVATLIDVAKRTKGRTTSTIWTAAARVCRR